MKSSTMQDIESNRNFRVCVVGAGLAGSMMACLLGKLNYTVSVYEQRPCSSDKLTSEFGSSVSPSKRSMNLALSYRGMLALGEIGILDRVMENAIRMPCRTIHRANGKTLRQLYGIENEAIWSISRERLNHFLVNTADSFPNVSVYYGYTVKSIDKSGTCQLETFPDNFKFESQFDLIIGADGAFSVAKSEMLKQGRVNHARDFIAHGYKELHIPPILDSDGNAAFAFGEGSGLHIWPRDDFMLIALPNSDKSYAATLFAPYEGKCGFNALHTSDEKTLQKYLVSNFPDAIALMPDASRQFHMSPVGSLMTTTVSPWFCGRTVLIGDAAHTVLPFFGQGMNSAFEDAYMLFRRLQSCRGDLLRAAAEFAEERTVSCNALAQLSRNHYHDMAKSTASFWYHLQKRFENVLRLTAPKLYMPLYAMISFTDIPYHIAIEREQRQQRFLKWTVGLLGFMTTFGCIKIGLTASHPGATPFLCELFKKLKLWGH